MRNYRTYLAALSIPFMIFAFWIDWRAAGIVFVLCWIDNILKGITND